MHRSSRLALIVALGLALSGCGSGDAPDDPPGAGGPAATAHDAAGAASVDVVDFAFAPRTITISTGTTVTWTNRDDFAHTVTSGTPDTPAGTFDEPLGSSGQHASSGTTATVAFDEPGTYPYFCDLHPSMTAEIVVTSP